MMKKLLLLSLILTELIQGSAHDDKAPSLKYGTSWAQGKPRYNEDRFDNDPENGFFGMYDGAGGSRIAVLASTGKLNENSLDKKDKNALEEIARNLGSKKIASKLNISTDSIKERIIKNNLNFKEAYEEFDKDIRNKIISFAKTVATKPPMRMLFIDKFFESLSTATTVKIDDENIQIAWAGDSRAIAFDKEGKIIETQDHNLKNETELTRVKNYFDTMFKTQKDKKASLEEEAANLKEKARIEKIITLEDRILPKRRKLKTTFGDLKKTFDQRFRDQGKNKTGNYMNAAHTRHLGESVIEKLRGKITTPEVISIPRNAVKYLILATDGLWDEVTNEDAAKKVIQIFTDKIEPRDESTDDKKEPRVEFTDDNKNNPKGTEGNSDKAKKAAEAAEALLALLKKKPNGTEGNSDKAEKAAEQLRDLALTRGSKDNIAVTVVEL